MNDLIMRTICFGSQFQRIIHTPLGVPAARPHTRVGMHGQAPCAFFGSIEAKNKDSLSTTICP